jgi:hypothetical protein
MIKGTEPFIVNPERKFTEAAVTKDKAKRRKKKEDDDEDEKEGDYLDSAYKSFEALTKSREHRGIMNRFYDW